MHYLRLFRWKNLLVIAIVQVLIKYALFLPYGIDMALNWFGFSLLVISTISIATAGYIINDIYDVETDLVNRPEKVIVGKTISGKRANDLFILFNIIGVLIGFYLSHLIGKNSFFVLFVLISALLYIYASYLKRTLLIGNIVVSILVAFTIIIVGIFDLLPVVNEQNRTNQITMFKVLMDYAFFAFIINLVREIIKDIEDVDGDHKSGMSTLPIVIGRERARNVAFVISLLPILGLVYYLSNYLYQQIVLVIYFLLFVTGPLIFVSIKIFQAKSKKDYNFISHVLKLILIFGMLSMLLYPIILK